MTLAPSAEVSTITPPILSLFLFCLLSLPFPSSPSLFLLFILSYTNRCVGLWYKTENKREFLERYAKSHGFDPHKAEEWYSHVNARVLPEKVERGDGEEGREERERGKRREEVGEGGSVSNNI